MVHGATSVSDVSINIFRISTTLEDREVELQSTMMEIQGTIQNHLVFVLMDLGANLNYISPHICGKV